MHRTRAIRARSFLSSPFRRTPVIIKNTIPPPSTAGATAEAAAESSTGFKWPNLSWDKVKGPLYFLFIMGAYGSVAARMNSGEFSGDAAPGGNHHIVAENLGAKLHNYDHDISKKIRFHLKKPEPTSITEVLQQAKEKREATSAVATKKEKKSKDASVSTSEKEKIANTNTATSSGTDKEVSKKKPAKPVCFVIDFTGSVSPTREVEKFREEITAVLMSGSVSRGDQVVIRLNSGSGTVRGYGLAAAQILRLKDAGFYVTVCVDEVAASGGYMMAACANKIVASPFAILGSIGVITVQPNVTKLLDIWGIKVEDVTAGKYKRTMVPYKESTSEDKKKVQQDVQSILKLFIKHLATNRPSMSAQELATGEVWYGTTALEKGLCDELKTSDQVLLEIKNGHRPSFSTITDKSMETKDKDDDYSLKAEKVTVLHIKYTKKKESQLKTLLGGGTQEAGASLMAMFEEAGERIIRNCIKNLFYEFCDSTNSTMIHHPQNEY
jgi:serine protease SohB